MAQVTGGLDNLGLEYTPFLASAWSPKKAGSCTERVPIKKKWGLDKAYRTIAHHQKCFWLGLGKKGATYTHTYKYIYIYMYKSHAPSPFMVSCWVSSLAPPPTLNQSHLASRGVGDPEPGAGLRAAAVIAPGEMGMSQRLCNPPTAQNGWLPSGFSQKNPSKAMSLKKGQTPMGSNQRVPACTKGQAFVHPRAHLGI